MRRPRAGGAALAGSCGSERVAPRGAHSSCRAELFFVTASAIIFWLNRTVGNAFLRIFCVMLALVNCCGRGRPRSCTGESFTRAYERGFIYGACVRKRLLIGVIAAFGVVAGFYVCSQLLDRGVKYHTQEYWDAFYERGRLQRLRDKVTVLLRLSVNRVKRAERREKRLAGHEARLIELGALEERSFDVFGHHPDVVVDFLTRQPGIVDRQRALVTSRPSFRLAMTESGEIVRVEAQGDFSVVVIAPKANMDDWEQRVWRADRVDSASK